MPLRYSRIHLDRQTGYAAREYALTRYRIIEHGCDLAECCKTVWGQSHNYLLIVTTLLRKKIIVPLREFMSAMMDPVARVPEIACLKANDKRG